MPDKFRKFLESLSEEESEELLDWMLSNSVYDGIYNVLDYSSVQRIVKGNQQQ